MAEKPHVNIMTTGHVDHGKSTLLGRLFYDGGGIPEQEMRKLQEKAKELHKETFEFAFVMDQLKEERERGLTIDLMYKGLETNRYYYTIIDAPGHRDFIKNMITGAAQADVVILVVSAKEGIQDQTKEHVYLCKILGVQQMLVAINKMDAMEYKEEAFNKTKEDVIKMITGVGYKPDKIPFIPTSGYMGDNVVKKSDKMPWYKGPSLIEAMDNIVTPPERQTDKPLRIPIQDVYTITGVGTVPVGRVESGVIKPNDKLVFMPSGAVAEVKSVEMHHKQMPQAVAGDNIGFNCRGVSKAEVRKGDVAGHANNPPTVAKEITGQIIVLQHPTVITKGYTPVFHVHTAHSAGKIIEIVKQINPQTGAVIKEHPDMLKSGDAAVIKVQFSHPVAIEKQSDFPRMAKFSIRDMGKTVAAGICLDLVKADTPAAK